MGIHIIRMEFFYDGPPVSAHDFAYRQKTKEYALLIGVCMGSSPYAFVQPCKQYLLHAFCQGDVLLNKYTYRLYVYVYVL